MPGISLFLDSFLEDRVLHKEAWVAKLLDTHLSIQVYKKVKFSWQDNSPLALKGLRIVYFISLKRRWKSYLDYNMISLNVYTDPRLNQSLFYFIGFYVFKRQLSFIFIFQAVIEGYLMPHIYDCIPKEHVDDTLIKEQYNALKNKTQRDLGVQSTYIDPSLYPYNDAVQKLREISFVRLPTQKLRSVILASQSVLKRMSELCDDEEVVAGAGKKTCLKVSSTSTSFDLNQIETDYFH